jgi:hypothetical protein
MIQPTQTRMTSLVLQVSMVSTVAEMNDSLVSTRRCVLHSRLYRRRLVVCVGRTIS